MGQQQLLLLVLGIVIVGLAVVAGINAFQENQLKSNKDALVTEAVRVATDIQAWKLKPSAFGGGGGSFSGFNWAKISVDDSNVEGGDATDGTAAYKTPWGSITFDATTGKLTLKDLNGNNVGTVTIAADGKITYSEPSNNNNNNNNNGG